MIILAPIFTLESPLSHKDFDGDQNNCKYKEQFTKYDRKKGVEWVKSNERFIVNFSHVRC